LLETKARRHDGSGSCVVTPGPDRLQVGRCVAKITTRPGRPRRPCRWRMLRSGTTNRSELPPCRETGNRALILPQLWSCSQPEGGVNRWGGVYIFTPHSQKGLEISIAKATLRRCQARAMYGPAPHAVALGGSDDTRCREFDSSSAAILSGGVR
jgi:hypothetical protein